MARKGILLAGGRGTRFQPMSVAMSKHFAPIYDKPMIYYALSNLMLAGIREVLVISNEQDLDSYRRLFGDGRQLGIEMSYACQKNPGGLPEAFIIGCEFIGGEKVALALGDNLIFGDGLPDKLKAAAADEATPTIFASEVRHPEAYGVPIFSKSGMLTEVVEKPSYGKGKHAIAGLYFFDNDVCEISLSLEASSRGELEIVDIINTYIQQGRMDIEILGRGIAWLDAGTPDLLLQASTFVQAVENRQGLKIGCLEEIALKNEWITVRDLLYSIPADGKGSYCEYLRAMCQA